MNLLVLSDFTFPMRLKEQQLNNLRFGVDINSRDSLIEILWIQSYGIRKPLSNKVFWEKILR